MKASKLNAVGPRFLCDIYIFCVAKINFGLSLSSSFFLTIGLIIQGIKFVYIAFINDYMKHIHEKTIMGHPYTLKNNYRTGHISANFWKFCHTFGTQVKKYILKNIIDTNTTQIYHKFQEIIPF